MNASLERLRWAVIVAGCSLLFWQYDGAPVDALFGIAVGLSLVLQIRMGEGFDLSWPQPLLAAFLVAAGVTTVAAAASPRAFGITAYLAVTSVAIGSAVRPDPNREIQVRRAMTLAAFVTAALVVLGYAASILDWPTRGLATPAPVQGMGLFKDPNVAGGFLAIVLPLSLAYAAEQPARPWMKAGVTVVIATGIIYTLSRMALALGAFGLLISLFQLRARRDMVAAILIGAALAGMLGLAGGGFSRQFGDVNPVDYSGGRVALWCTGAELFRAAPWGTGSGSFEVRSTQLVESGSSPCFAGGLTTKVFSASAHQTYIRLFVESGLVGGLLFFGYLVALAVARSSRARRPPWWWWAALLIVLLAGLIIDTLHWRSLWISLALFASATGPGEGDRPKPSTLAA